MFIIKFKACSKHWFLTEDLFTICAPPDPGLSQLCSLTRLRALDLGRTGVTDEGLDRLAQSLDSLVSTATFTALETTLHLQVRLGLRGCRGVTDRGLASLSLHLPGLRHLTVREVQGLQGWGVQEVRRSCRRCVIEHSLPGL